HPLALTRLFDARPGGQLFGGLLYLLGQLAVQRPLQFAAAGLSCEQAHASSSTSSATHGMYDTRCRPTNRGGGIGAPSDKTSRRRRSVRSGRSHQTYDVGSPSILARLCASR